MEIHNHDTYVHTEMQKVTNYLQVKSRHKRKGIIKLKSHIVHFKVCDSGDIEIAGLMWDLYINCEMKIYNGIMYTYILIPNH